MNADLQRERSQATFSVERLTNLLDGGVDKTRRRRYLESIITSDTTGVFDNSQNNYLHRTDRHVRSLAKHVRLIELCRKLGIGSKYNGEIVLDPDFATLVQSLGDDLPTSLHWIMFVPNLMSLGDDEQQKEWLPLCRDWKMIGCYAQTELGHGSNVRAMETTATFVSEQQGGLPGGSFVINSPSLTSYKFWPGSLGRTANHAVVIARLIDGEGVDHGVHNFLVQLRSMDSHELMPGVETGDIGPKIGYNVMDNGFACFNNVVIPRRNMAMRFAQVDEDGKYTKTSVTDATSKVAYITMMLVRAYLCNEAGKNLAMACTIAIRYSALRRQGYGEDDKTELQILDYKQQQHRLFPLLASSYCFFFTGRKVLQRLYDTEKRLVQQGDDVTKAEVADLHATSSALKSFMTMTTADGMEDCRKACGGHGFLACSGLPELVTTYLQSPTVEGDNHMLPQQVFKVLLKTVGAVVGRGNLSEFDACDSRHLIAELRAIAKGSSKSCAAESIDDLLNLETILHAFCHRASRLLLEGATQYHELTSAGKSQQEAWNTCLVQMARVSRAYSQFLLVHNFIEGIETEKSGQNAIGLAEVAVLSDLARLFGLYWIEKEMGDFLEDQYLSTQQATWVRQAVLRMLDSVRPNAVALVDARDISDFKLKSALGRFDGNVYPAIIAAARADPLNAKSIGPGYEEHLKRLTVGGIGVYSGTISRL